MKKLFTSTLVISSLVLAPALKADDPVTDDATTEPQIEEHQDEYQSEDYQRTDYEDDEGTPVGQASQDGSNAARKKRWQNIALAAGAVAIAVTAIILVANNDGHKD